MKSTQDLILFISVLVLGSGAAAAPIAFPNLEKDLKNTYLGVTSACLTFVATAYQIAKSEKTPTANDNNNISE